MNTISHPKAPTDCFHTLFDLIPDPAYIWEKREPGGLCLAQANAAAVRVSSGKITGFLGSTAAEFFKDDPSIIEDLEFARAAGEMIIRETPYVFRSTGQTSHLEVFCQGLSASRVVAICRQVDRQKSLTEALEHTEHRYQTLMEGLQDGVVFLDANGIARVANAGFLRLIPDGAAIGRSILDVVPPDLRQGFGRWLLQIMENDSCAHTELNWNTSISRLILRVNSFKVSDGLLLQFHDITADRRLEDEVSRRQRMEAVSSVARQIAHDFNNFLSPLIGIPDVLKMRIRMDPNTEKLINLIQSAAQQMSEINSQLMCLSRIAHPVREPIRINDLIQSTIQMMPIPESVEIHYRFSPELPLISGDESQLLRILTNLLKNALEATQNAGRITVATDFTAFDATGGVNRPISAGQYVRVSLTDTGPGVPALVAQSIFDPFFSTKQTPHRKGLGLGLSVVSDVIAEHRGFVDFFNPGQGGACFQLYFPVQGQLVRAEARPDAARGVGESILIVDDNPLYLDVLSHMLLELGYSVDTRDSGSAALEYITRRTVDLVILDMIMQPMDGAETFERMLRINPGQRAIIISAFSDSDRIRHTRSLGIAGCVAKPVSFTKLASAVRRALEKPATA